VGGKGREETSSTVAGTQAMHLTIGRALQEGEKATKELDPCDSVKAEHLMLCRGAAACSMQKPSSNCYILAPSAPVPPHHCWLWDVFALAQAGPT
jgi:hypothetical protein